jgi:hypothetical protein
MRTTGTTSAGWTRYARRQFAARQRDLGHFATSPAIYTPGTKRSRQAVAPRHPEIDNSPCNP